MNTDNMTISGETIDYGPCAFMDAFDPATVFSSIDHGGRYAYGNQPPIAQWNLARLGRDAAAAVRRRHRRGGRGGHRRAARVPRPLPARTGSRDARQARARRRAPGATTSWSSDLLDAAAARSASTTRRSSGRCRRRARRPAPARSLFADPDAFDAWADRLARRQCGRPRTRSRPRWTGSTRSTSRATTSSRRRWPRRPPATSSRSGGCSTSLGAAVRRAPGPGALRRAGPAELRPVPHVLRHLRPTRSPGPEDRSPVVHKSRARGA